jgi:carbon monoxide dehydrogenase subunit G
MLTIALYIIGGLLLLILLIGFTSPQVAKMERSVTIKATPDKIWPYLNNLKSFVDNWSPWTVKDPNANHNYNDIEAGVGALYTWKGEPKKVGEGSMEIKTSEPMELVKVLLQFKGRGDAMAGWIIRDNGDGTTMVTWDFESDNGMNPISRIFGRMMDKFLGPDYQNGLNKLKAICEV